MTCVLVTHEMGVACEMARQRRICVTDKGLIAEHGKPDEFSDDPRDARTRAVPGHVLV